MQEINLLVEQKNGSIETNSEEIKAALAAKLVYGAIKVFLISIRLSFMAFFSLRRLATVLFASGWDSAVNTIPLYSSIFAARARNWKADR